MNFLDLKVLMILIWGINSVRLKKIKVGNLIILIRFRLREPIAKVEATLR